MTFHEPPLPDMPTPAEPVATDWTRYRKCSQVCRAPIGEPCFSLSGRISGGRPDAVITVLDRPHHGRQLRTRRGRRVS